MKLSVDLLDNEVKSAVINVGKNNGYVEAYIDDAEIVLSVYSKEGDIVFDKRFALAMLRDKDASEAFKAQQTDDDSWRA